ncbi:MAG TPA: oligosaccharide flippase family protein [Candidatus Cybelea sp.]|jgi:O-antigen/teichoic acid export membrane protein|nr:oligosaccharide flippase family protein [Candidatus Cybelea sp.]
MSGIARKSFETFVVRVATQLLAAGGGIVVARTLLPAGKGEFTYVGTILGFALMMAVGHTRAVLWQYGKRAIAAGSVLRVMVFIVAAVSVPLAVVTAAIGAFVPSQHSLLFVAVALPFAMFAQSAGGLFLADGDVRTLNVKELLPNVLAPLVYVPIVVFFDRSLWVVLAAWAGGYIVAAGYIAFALRRYDRTVPAPTDLQALAKEQISFGGHAGLSSLLQYVDFRIDVFLVMFMLGSAALGIYSVGIAIGEFIWQLSSAMINPSLRDIGGKDFERAAEVTAKCMRHSLLLVFIAALAVALLARTVVPLLYGPAFSYGAVLTIALLPGIIAYSMMPALSAFFSQQLGRPRVPSYFSALSAGVCALITALALPRFGLIAAALATSISYSAAFVLATIYFTRVSGLSFARTFAYSTADLRPYRSLLTGAMGALRGR